MSRAVRNDGRYSRVPEDGGEWPEILVGITQIARCLRIDPETAEKWLRDERMPGVKDARGRWVTTRGLIELWILERAGQSETPIAEAVRRGTLFR